MLKKFLFLLTFITFSIVIFNFAYSADQTTTTPSTTPSQVGAKPVISLFQCPAGWQKKPNTPDLVCIPAKPTPIKCPDGYKYYENLKCSAMNYFGSCQAQGCEIGCAKIEIPK